MSDNDLATTATQWSLRARESSLRMRVSPPSRSASLPGIESTFETRRQYRELLLTARTSPPM